MFFGSAIPPVAAVPHPVSRLLRRATLLLFLVLGIALGTGGQVADEPECTVTLQPGESIQEAIDAAEPGTVICLMVGEYLGNVRIDKSLTLRGLGEREEIQLVEADNSAPVITITTEEGAARMEVALENISIAPTYRLSARNVVEIGGESYAVLQDMVISKAKRYALVVMDNSVVEVNDCAFLSNKNALLIKDQAYITLLDTSVKHTDDKAVKTSQASGRLVIERGYFFLSGLEGVSLRGALDVRISNSEFDDVDIALVGTGSALLKNCTVSVGSQGYCVLAGGEVQLTLVDCTLTNRRSSGVWLMGSSNSILDSCTISGCLHTGVEIMQQSNAEIRNCRIFDNDEYGLSLAGENCLGFRHFPVPTNFFTGSVFGSGNYIPGPDDAEDGNGLAGVCPADAEAVLTAP